MQAKCHKEKYEAVPRWCNLFMLQYLDMLDWPDHPRNGIRSSFYCCCRRVVHKFYRSGQKVQDLVSILCQKNEDF